jgi:hypothetical protein
MGWVQGSTSLSIAYLVVAHRNGPQLRRLLSAIDHPEHAYVLHVDRRADAPVHDAARAFAEAGRNVRVLPSRKIIWGGSSLLEVQLAGIEAALRTNLNWQYLINLSGQCYPLVSQDALSRALDAGGQGRNYMERLDYVNCSPPIRPRTRRWHVEVGDSVVRVPLLRRGLPTAFRVFWGSNFMTLSRAFCEHLFSGDEAVARCRRYFQFVRMPEEFFFQTALMNSRFDATLVADNKRKIIWTGGPHPRTLTMSDLPALLTSGAWFARKLDDAVDPDVLDALDRHRLAAQAAAV